MLRFSRRLVVFVIVICAFKVLGTTFVPFYSPNQIYWGNDFYNWVSGARFLQIALSQGSLPSLASTGAYTGLMLLLAPFYWLWTALPIPHPSLAEMAAHPSTEEYLLVLVMKIPIILCDLLAGFLTALLVQRATHSTKAAQKAFFVWYLNPFNIFWMYYFGGFDVVPTTVVLLAALFGNSRHWFRSGFCLAVAGLLRLFPFLLLPFFLAFSYRDKLQSSVKLLVSFLLPVFGALLSQVSAMESLSRALLIVLNLPLEQNWLLQHYGYSIATGMFRSTPFLLTVQLYVVCRYWKMDPSPSLVEFSIAPLLALFVSSYAEPYHFIWISPLLTAYYIIERDRLQLFILTFLFGSLFVAGFTTQQPLYPFLPLVAGLFYGIQAAYLLKLNLGALRPQIRTVLTSLRLGQFGVSLDAKPPATSFA